MNDLNSALIEGALAAQRAVELQQKVEEVNRRLRITQKGAAYFAKKFGGNEAESPLTREDVLLGALRCICGGDAETAGKLLGNS